MGSTQLHKVRNMENTTKKSFPSEWEPRVTNLLKQFPSVKRDEVVQLLLEQNGHAGQTASRLQDPDRLRPKERRERENAARKERSEREDAERRKHAAEKRRETEPKPAQILTEEQVQAYWRDFSNFDVDKSGFLERNEIRQLIKHQLGSYECTEEGIQELLAEFDQWDGADTDSAAADGKINFAEYLGVLLGKDSRVETEDEKMEREEQEDAARRKHAAERRRNKGPQPAQIISDYQVQTYRRDFDKFDVDKSGFLEKAEIKQLIKLQLGSYECSEDGIQELMAEFDGTGGTMDGKINFEEYLGVVLGRGSRVETDDEKVKRKQREAAERERRKKEEEEELKRFEKEHGYHKYDTTRNCDRFCCVAGHNQVLMSTGGLREMRSLRRGDMVATGEGVAEVLCVVKNQCDSHLAELGALRISPNHPIRLQQGKWVMPGSVASVRLHADADIYNCLLSQGHTIFVEGVECVTLGHSFTDENVAHPYYG